MRIASVLYAAYGSNLHPVRLRERAPSAILLGTAAVAGRALRFHKRSKDGSGKCNVVESEAEIHVAVYAMARNEKRQLDRIEGVGSGYRVETLDIAGYGPCFVYVAAERHIDESLRPFSWYKDLVIAGCEYLGFPEHYIERISAVASVEDPDRERHASRLRILTRARSHTER